MIIPKLSGNINLCNFKRLPKFERCGLSLLTATPTVPRLMPHPVYQLFICLQDVDLAFGHIQGYTLYALFSKESQKGDGRKIA